MEILKLPFLVFQGFFPPPPHLPLSGSTTKKKWKHLSVNILVLIFINTQSFGINKFLNTRRRFQTRHRNWLNLISDLLDNPVSLFCRNSKAIRIIIFFIILKKKIQIWEKKFKRDPIKKSKFRPWHTNWFAPNKITEAKIVNN